MSEKIGCTECQDGERRHFEFRKSATISLFNYRFSPKYMTMLQKRYRKQKSCQKKTDVSNFNMAAAAIFNFEKQQPLPHLSTDFHQTLW
jgi:hypothetical protein